jgi:5'-3' exonuclease
VKERLAADGYLLWGIDGFEADDLIATAAAKAVNAGHDVRIASADKDLMAMLSESVDCLRTHTWTVVGVSAFVEKYGVRPGQFSDWLALVGDASDNIKGAPGVGPKRATELLKEYEYLDVVLAAATDPAEKVHDSAIGKSLRENAEAVRMARKLVELRTDAPIAFEAIYEKREAKPLEEVDLSEIDDDFPKVEGAPPALESGGSTSLSTELSDPASTGEIATYAGPQVEYSRALEPRSFKELVIGCKVLYNARIYAKYPSYESMVGAGMRGREMGYGLGPRSNGSWMSPWL